MPDEVRMQRAAGVLAAQRPSRPGSALEGMILGVWEDLVADGRAECPVCSGSMTQSGCEDCGSQLS